MYVTMVEFRRPCDMADIRYVLIHRIAEKDRSLIAFFAGITIATNAQA